MGCDDNTPLFKVATMKLILTIVILALSSFSYCQTLGVGYGVRQDNNAFLISHISLNDSVTITKPLLDYDGLRPFVLTTYQKEIRNKTFVHFSALFMKKFTTFQFHRFVSSAMFTVSKFPFIISRTLILSGGMGTKITRRIEIVAGLGAAFHFNRHPLIFDFTDTPDLNEAVNQIQKIHKKITFNYSFQIEYNIFSDFFLGITKNGSLGEVTNELHTAGKSYRIPVKWESIGLFVSYKKNIDEFFDIFHE